MLLDGGPRLVADHKQTTVQEVPPGPDNASIAPELVGALYGGAARQPEAIHI